MNKPAVKQPIIVRIWRGRTPRESVDAMSKFTGGDPRKIHHLERDSEFLIELPKEVQILRLLTSHGITDLHRKSCLKDSIQLLSGSKRVQERISQMHLPSR